MSTSKTFFQRKSITALFAILLVAVLVSINIGQQPAYAASLPCDIFGNCVAAHSTVRALYGSYSGNLYQVKRASDGSTTNIGVLSAGGYANAAAQDSFCSGTTCTVTEIYDQSGHGNNLTVGPAGGAAGADSASSATAAKITIAGHEAYGVYINGSGNGYRDDKTSGIATGDNPETEYAVFGGTHYNNGCCYDYGNAETNNDDDGAGTMEAIYFGTEKTWGYGAGNGPWVMADMENGLFSGSSAGLNSGDQTVSYTYLTAIVKGEANQWAIKAGNAASGSLTSMYSGVRPSGYNPMKKQGAIILGIGGDNSHSASGTFYEGAMTSGYSSDSTDNSVQSNIVAAGYGSGGSGGTYNKIVGQNSGKCVDVQQPNTQAGANVDLYTCNGDTWQNWQFNSLGNGYYTVVSQNSGLCLDVTGASKSSGANVEQWTCNGGTNQAWSWTANGSYFVMKNENSGMCLNVVGNGTADTTNIDQETCSNGSGQNWSKQ